MPWLMTSPESFVMLLTGSDILELPKLHGFLFPGELPFQDTSPAFRFDAIHREDGDRTTSFGRLHTSRHMDAPLDVRFWQRVSRACGIEGYIVKYILLRLLEARRLYHRYRQSGPALVFGTNLGYLADILCDHRRKLVRGAGLSTIAAPTATNVKRGLDAREDGAVAKKRRSSEASPAESHSSGSRFSKSKHSPPYSRDYLPQFL
ncbi:hypothetical protein CHU98_g8972 [Xylaria longipes]|nr:hypothetical protein CHU98_g8972 [Xylaria longipes]